MASQRTTDILSIMDESQRAREFEKFKAFLKVQGDYGKWLAATVSLLHASALYAIAEGKLPNLPNGSYLPFLIGLVAMMLSAFSTWANFTLNAQDSLLKADYGVPTSPRLEWRINATLHASVTLGLLSGLAFIAGAVWLAS